MSPTPASVVSSDARGRAWAARWARPIARAAADGYRARRFNAVVEANHAAVRLWRSLGFEVLATTPEAFDHPTEGLVGLHLMHRRLSRISSRSATLEPFVPPGLPAGFQVRRGRSPEGRRSSGSASRSRAGVFSLGGSSSTTSRPSPQASTVTPVW